MMVWFILFVFVEIQFTEASHCDYDILSTACSNNGGYYFNNHCFFVSSAQYDNVDDSITECINVGVSTSTYEGEAGYFGISGRIANFYTYETYLSVMANLSIQLNQNNFRIGLLSNSIKSGYIDSNDFIWISDISHDVILPWTWSIDFNTEIANQSWCAVLDYTKPTTQFIIRSCYKDLTIGQMCEILCNKDNIPCWDCPPTTQITTTSEALTSTEFTSAATTIITSDATTLQTTLSTFASSSSSTVTNSASVEQNTDINKQTTITTAATTEIISTTTPAVATTTNAIVVVTANESAKTITANNVETSKIPSSVITTDFMTHPYDSISETTKATTTAAYNISSATTADNSKLFNLFDITPELVKETMALSSTIADSIPFLVAHLNDSIKQQIGYQISDIVERCTFNGVPCDLEQDFEYLYNPLLGNCFIYNAGINPKRWSFHAGEPYALWMLLSVNEPEYICATVSAGFRIVIHENQVTPFPDAEGYSVPMGATTRFGLYNRRYVTFNEPSGKCADYEFQNFKNNSYSIEACQRDCFQTKLMNACHCADPRYPLPIGAEFCLEKSKYCLDFMKNCEPDDSCDCPTRCNTTYYQATITRATLIDCDIPTPTIQSSETSQYTTINVYYQDMTSFIFVEMPAYSLNQFFSDFCGEVGLLLGVGIISFIELVVLVFMTIENFCRSIELKV